MIESQNIRQILAIMVTDIVDYTETMNNDEQKAWEYLKKQRTLIPPMISKMNGHMFKEMGDGTFSKFKSAIDAVQCAVKIQEEAINNELPIRIAVHLGDVMDDGVDVIGTGVNIASRINSLAETGNIVISEDVWRQIRNQENMDATSLGQKDIKGFHQTVEVFELTYNPDGTITKKVKVTETVTITDEEGKEVQTEAAKKEFIKKVAIFPFEYDGEDKSLNFLKYGFPFGCSVSLLQDPLVEIEFPNEEELHGSDFIYQLRKSGYEKGEHVPLALKKKIAKELHCDYFIFGNIIFEDSNFQIESKIFNVANGKLVSEFLKKSLDYFSLIDDFSLQFKKDINIPSSHIEEIENIPFSEITTESTDAYKQFIEGILIKEYENDYENSIKSVIEATKIDPTFSLANFSLYWSAFLSNNEKYTPYKDQSINNALAHLYKLPARLSYLIKMHNYFFHKGDAEKAVKVIQMWKRQYPESLSPNMSLGRIYQRQRKFDEAIEVYNEVLNKYPEYTKVYHELCDCFAGKNDFENALIYGEKYLEKCPSEAVSYAYLGWIHGRMGNNETCKDYREQALMLESDNCRFMCKVAEADLSLGNFSEAEDQINEALNFCKTNQDFDDVYEIMGLYFLRRGRIKESIEANEKSAEYLAKFQNPIDSLLSTINKLPNYVLIGRDDEALKKLDNVTEKLLHPFNLLAGFGQILLGGINGDKELLKTGINNMEEFLKIKDFPWLNIFSPYGNAMLNMHENNYNKAINLFEELFIHAVEMRSEIVWYITKCHNKNKDYQSAIKVATEELEKEPYQSKIILELSKSYIAEDETQKAKENLTKILSIWEDADEEYIYLKEAKKLWKELNTVKEPA